MLAHTIMMKLLVIIMILVQGYTMIQIHNIITTVTLNNFYTGTLSHFLTNQLKM